MYFSSSDILQKALFSHSALGKKKKNIEEGGSVINPTGRSRRELCVGSSGAFTARPLKGCCAAAVVNHYLFLFSELAVELHQVFCSIG